MLVWTVPMDTASRGMWKNGGKRNKLFSVWEPPMIYLAWKVLGCSKSFLLVDGYTSQKNLSLNLCFVLWYLYKSPLHSVKGLSIYFYAIFIFIWVFIFYYKASTREHYDHTGALDVVNIRVCFMNGSMIEHNGLGIVFFSVDILIDMVAC